MATATSSERRTSVRGLGEIAFRVNNLDAMQRFYEEVIDLPLMTRVPNCAFFKIADGYSGHTQVLALFDRSQTPGYRGTNAATSTIDHIAFEIPLADFEHEKKRLEALGLQVETAEHAWVHWRSLICDRSGGESSGTGLLRRQCLRRPAVWHNPSRAGQPFSQGFVDEPSSRGYLDNDAWVGALLSLPFDFALFGAAVSPRSCGRTRIGEAVWRELSSIQALRESLAPDLSKVASSVSFPSDEHRHDGKHDKQQVIGCARNGVFARLQ